MTMGEQIKGARESKNLSQEELAEQLGVSRQAVSKWENDTSLPQGINREALSKVLGLELPKPEGPVKSKEMGWLGWLGWIAACVLLALLLSVVRTRETDGVAQPNGGGGTESPAIKSIAFYDGDQNIVEDEALWYDAAQIESVLIQWEGGTPDNIKMFATPSGSETMEETELLLVKAVLDGDSAELLNAEPLRNGVSSHVFFELSFGQEVLSSDLYNVFNSEAYG